MTRRSHPIDRVIADNLVLFRKNAGMSQSELGDRIGVSFQQVQKYENTANRIAASRLWQCSEALGVPVQEFFVRRACDLSAAAGMSVPAD